MKLTSGLESQETRICLTKDNYVITKPSRSTCDWEFVSLKRCLAEGKPQEIEKSITIFNLKYS